MNVDINKGCLILMVLLLLALHTPVAAQESVEERLNRLEFLVDSLRGVRVSPARVIPGLETIVDTPYVQYGITSIVDRKLDKKYFYVNHNDDWKIAYWVAHHLTAENLEGTAKRDKKWKFRVDGMPQGKGGRNEDYTHSGRERGHMAPAGDFKQSVVAMKSTFVYSNASPQFRGFNNGMWKQLETEIRLMVSDIGEAWIVTGNVFLSDDTSFISPRIWIGHDDELNVAVPTHLFKAILAKDEDGDFSTYAFLIPNERQHREDPTEEYQISMDRLEQITGYDFFPEIEDSDENDIENIVREWPW